MEYLQNVLGQAKFFYAKMHKQERILIPKLMLTVIVNKENPNLEGYIFEAWLEPV